MNMHFAGDIDTKDEGEDGNLDDNNDENKGKLSSLMKRKAHTRIWNVFPIEVARAMAQGRPLDCFAVLRWAQSLSSSFVLISPRRCISASVRVL